MDFFFAGMEDPLVAQEYFARTGEKLNVLFSFYTIGSRIDRIVDLFSPVVKKMMLDSGAFSLFTKNEAEITRFKQIYTNFLKYNSDFLNEKFDCVFTLDYRSNFDGFEDNFDMFKQLHCVYRNVVPVIHSLGAGNPEILAYEKFLPHTIAIGQNKFRNRKSHLGQLIGAINSIQRKSKCHLLGVSDYKMLSKLKTIDSCDSTSWLKCANCGVVLRYKIVGNMLESQSIYFPNKEGVSRKGTVTLEEMLGDEKNEFLREMKENLNLTRNDFFNNNSCLSRCLANIYYTLKMVNHLFVENSLGTKG